MDRGELVSGERAAGHGAEYAPGDRRADAARVAVFAPYAVGIYRGNGFMGAQQDWNNAVGAAVGWEYEESGPAGQQDQACGARIPRKRLCGEKA